MSVILACSTTNWDVAVEILGPVWNDGTAHSYSVKFPSFIPLTTKFELG